MQKHLFPSRREIINSREIYKLTLKYQTFQTLLELYRLLTCCIGLKSKNIQLNIVSQYYRTQNFCKPVKFIFYPNQVRKINVNLNQQLIYYDYIELIYES